MNEAALLVGALAAIAILSGIVMYNRLVAARIRIRESWSNVDTELKRRHDLVPALVEVVRGYAAHERAVFDEASRLRAEALGARAMPERADAERGLGRALARVVAVAEAYPQLRASEAFLKLQHQLVETEDRIQAARRFFNGNVREYNNRVEAFPSSLVASLGRFEPHGYFELPDVAAREAPAVRP